MKCLVLLLAFVLVSAAQAQDKHFSMPPFHAQIAKDFGSVGRVNKGGFNGRWTCSGTLVRPDVVLTAGHCAAPISANSKAKHMFVAGWNRGEYIAARKIVRTVRHPAYLITGRHDPRFDLGLLFLESPITEVAPMPMGETLRDVVGIAGYHRFIPHLLTGRLNCRVLSRDQWLLRIDCPVVSGNSGGPVLEFDTERGWQVTAVVSSQEKRRRSLRALAVQIPEWVHDTLAER